MKIDPKSRATDEMSRFGDELVQSARQALEFAEGEAELGAFRVTTPAELDVKAIRAKLKLTRAEFARRFRIPIGALEDARRQIGAFIETVYNVDRLHSALGYKPPAEFEADLARSRKRQPKVEAALSPN